MRRIELLAPAKNLECGIVAIDHGADAVYIGAQRFGARAAAGNSVADIAALCRYAHVFGAKVYVTVNTILYDDELEDTRLLLSELDRVGVDAVLVQDMALLELGAKSLVMQLHASTQTDNRTAEKVAWLLSFGFTRVVLARELSAAEIAEIHRQVPDVELEVFVHGALCVSYSGVCYASQHCFGRSANRGECAQFCRLRFDLKDADGKEIEHQRHLLSLRDLCQIDNLEVLMDAGATSFKIEGRLKDISYVKNVVAAYSQRLNGIIEKHPGKYQRASNGSCAYTFTPNLKKTFNRGFTDYFLNGRRPDIVSFDTPKAMGEYVGKVKEIRGNSFNVAGTASFSNGDGLCFINARHELEGFRVNRVEGNRIFPLSLPSRLHPGMALYRNNDQEFERILSKTSAVRKIPLHMKFNATECGFSLSAGGVMVECELEKQPAQKPQRENIIRQLAKLGNTPYVCGSVEIEGDTGKYFIPSSLLAGLRRRLVETLMQKTPLGIQENGNGENKKRINVGERLPLRSGNAVPADRKEDTLTDRQNKAYAFGKTLAWQPEYKSFPYLYNISNLLAARFYERQGMENPSPAFEIEGKGRSRHTSSGAIHTKLIMQCRYCLRYSLGFCVKRGGKKPSWREPLYMELPDNRTFRLEFNCRECQMDIYAE